MPFRFLKFPVYQSAKNFYNEIVKHIDTFPIEEKYSLASQLRRAALSIVLNIAEGSDRGSDKDFNRYLMQALGSLNEVVAGLDIAREQKYMSIEVFEKLIRHGEELSNQLGGFSKTLKASS